MSVFLKNECKFSNCSKLFTTLSDLIIHIEKDHIDFNPEIIEISENEKPEHLPLSYVIRYSGLEDKEQPVELSFVENSNDGLRSNNENVIDKSFDIDNFECENNIEILPDNIENEVKFSEILFKSDYSDYMSCKNNNVIISSIEHKKPYACNIPGCLKRYKNINGVKYHQRNYHKIGPIIKKSINKHNKNSLLLHSHRRNKADGFPTKYSSYSNDTTSYYNRSCRSFEDNLISTEYFYKINNTGQVLSSAPSLEFISNNPTSLNTSLSFNSFDCNPTNELDCNTLSSLGCSQSSFQYNSFAYYY